MLHIYRNDLRCIPFFWVLRFLNISSRANDKMTTRTTKNPIGSPKKNSCVVSFCLDESKECVTLHGTVGFAVAGCLFVSVLIRWFVEFFSVAVGPLGDVAGGVVVVVVVEVVVVGGGVVVGGIVVVVVDVVEDVFGDWVACIVVGLPIDVVVVSSDLLLSVSFVIEWFVSELFSVFIVPLLASSVSVCAHTEHTRVIPKKPASNAENKEMVL